MSRFKLWIEDCDEVKGGALVKQFKLVEVVTDDGEPVEFTGIAFEHEAGDVMQAIHSTITAINCK